MLVAGCYSGFRINIKHLCLDALGESIHPGRHIFNLIETGLVLFLHGFGDVLDHLAEYPCNDFL